MSTLNKDVHLIYSSYSEKLFQVCRITVKVNAPMSYILTFTNLVHIKELFTEPTCSNLLQWKRSSFKAILSFQTNLTTFPIFCNLEKYFHHILDHIFDSYLIVKPNHKRNFLKANGIIPSHFKVWLCFYILLHKGHFQNSTDKSKFAGKKNFKVIRKFQIFHLEI